MADAISEISLITVSLNASATLRDNLESVRQQKIPVEQILIDGGSTDDSIEIAREYPQISRIFSEPDRGIYDAMNKGLSLVKGDVVGILNADDFYAGPGALDKVANIFQDNSIDSCYGDLQYVDRYSINRVVRHWRAGQFKRKRFLNGWMPPHPTFFVRRSVYDRLGSFNLNLGSAADYELMLRFLIKNQITTAYIPEVLVKMRIGGKSNASLKNRIIANQFDRMAWKVNGLNPYPWTLTLKPLRKIGQYIFK